MKKIIFLFTLSLFLFAETKEIEIKEKIVTVGVENINYYPHYSADKGEYSGFARALLDAFAKDSGYNFVYHPLPVKRLFANFIAGELDLKYPDNSYWGVDSKKEIKIIYSKPVIEYIDGTMIVPANKNRGLKEFKTLGTVLGFTPYAYLELIDKKEVKILENPSFTGVLMQAIDGRVDGAYINVDVAKFALNELIREPNSLIFDDSLPHIKDYYYLSSINRPEIIKEFDEWMIKNRDKIEELKIKFRLK